MEIKNWKNKWWRQICNEIFSLLNEKKLEDAKKTLTENLDFLSRNTPEDLCRVLIAFLEKKEFNFILGILSNDEIKKIISKQRYIHKILKLFIEWWEIWFVWNTMSDMENAFENMSLEMFFKLLKLIHKNKWEAHVLKVLKAKAIELFWDGKIQSVPKAYLWFINRKLRYEYDKVNEEDRDFLLLLMMWLDVIYYKKKWVSIWDDFSPLWINTKEDVDKIIFPKKISE